jgi:hypothetical protein
MKNGKRALITISDPSYNLFLRAKDIVVAYSNVFILALVQ